MRDEWEIEALMDRLDEIAGLSVARDAIDRTVAGAPRTSAATTLRNHDAVRRFREELAQGLVQADTARQLLGLVRIALEGMVRP